MRKTSLRFRQKRKSPRAKRYVVTIVESQAGFMLFSSEKLDLRLILSASFWTDEHWADGQLMGLKTVEGRLQLEVT